jgi:hypothetical protein
MPFLLRVTLWIIMYAATFAVADKINVQFLLGDAENGTFEGTYTVIFGLYDAPNVPIEEALWKEEHTLMITEGKVSQMLGSKIPLDYTLFKSDELYIGLRFKELDDAVFVPFISVPSAIVSRYARYAQSLEFTESWMAVDTQNHRVGIGITQNLTVPFEVIGTMNVTTVNVTGGIYAADGSNIDNVDYNKLLNLDDYSLSPFSPESTEMPKPDVVFVTTEGQVGVGIPVTADITEQLHVSGNLRVDNGMYAGQSNIRLIGDAGPLPALESNDEGQPFNGPMFVWNSAKWAVRAGYASDGVWDSEAMGEGSAAFGRDNKVLGNYGFSTGIDNTVTAENGLAIGGKNNTVSVGNASIVGGINNTISSQTSNGKSAIIGGESNSIQADYAAILGGKQNQIVDSHTTGSFAAIMGGHNNSIIAAPMSIIVGGESNHVWDNSDYSLILGGRGHEIYGQGSVALGQYGHIGNPVNHHDGVFLFADSTRSNANPLKSSDSNQFLIFATNGVLIGLSDFDYTTPFVIPGASPKTFPPAEGLKSHSIRTAGDIVAADDEGNLGYLVGDGSYITNLASVWDSDDNARSIHTTMRVGIGAPNDTLPPDSSLLISENTGNGYPAAMKWQSSAGSYMTMGVNGTIPYVNASDPIAFQLDGSTKLTITNEGSRIDDWLGVGRDPEKALDVEGAGRLSGDLTVGSLTTEGTVTAKSFIGKGDQLTDIAVNTLTPNDGTPYQQLYMNDDGWVRLGHTINTIGALLHIGDAETTQLRLEETDLDGYYTTIHSSDKLMMTFHNYKEDFDHAFSFNTQKSGSVDVPSVLIITGGGDVGLGVDAPQERLDVAGTVQATAFKGEGSALTGVQLDVDQDNPVTFSKTVTASEAIQMTPQDANLSCALEEIGLLWTITDTNASRLTLCFCAAEASAVNVLDPTDTQTCSQ